MIELSRPLFVFYLVWEFFCGWLIGRNMYKK